jgi:hypothetical protein
VRAFRRYPAEFLGGLSREIRKKIDDCEGRVPVITGIYFIRNAHKSRDHDTNRLIIGFFGAMPESLTIALGEGTQIFVPLYVRLQ